MLYAQWVGFGRMAFLRASRRQAGSPSLPAATVSPTARADAHTVSYLQDLLHEMQQGEGATEEAEVAAAEAVEPAAAKL